MRAHVMSLTGVLLGVMHVPGFRVEGACHVIDWSALAHASPCLLHTLLLTACAASPSPPFAPSAPRTLGPSPLIPHGTTPPLVTGATNPNALLEAAHLARYTDEAYRQEAGVMGDHLADRSKTLSLQALNPQPQPLHPESCTANPNPSPLTPHPYTLPLHANPTTRRPQRPQRPQRP